MKGNTDILIEKINELYESEVKNQPFDVLHSLGIHENNHSRLLCELLNKDKAIIDFFVNNVLQIKEISFSEKVIAVPLKSYIDVLINDNHYAIIIENKVCWAKNQDGQICNYIDTVIHDYNITEENIYVVYLTTDGTQQIQYSDNYQDRIQKLNDRQRLILKNYKVDILNWLENYKFPNSIVLDGYISFLKNYVVNDKSNDYQIYEKIYNEIKAEEGVNNLLIHYKDKTDSHVHFFVRWLTNYILYKSLSEPFLSYGYFNDKPFFRINGNNIYILFFKKEWNTEWYIHFEYILNIQKVTLRLEIHFEKTNSDKRVKSTKKEFKKSRLPGTIDIPLNNDLTINEENRIEINSFIKNTTQFLDEQLINKQ
jgi:hypothetical protein